MNFIKKWIWIILGSLTLIIGGLSSPEFIERFYSRGLYLFIRKIFDAVTNSFPFALVYILFIILIISILSLIYKFKKSQKSTKEKLKNGGLNLINFVFAIIFLFQFLWGFNYQRIPLEKQMGIEPKPLSLADLKFELDTSTHILLKLRNQIPNITDSTFSEKYLPPNLENLMRKNLKKVLQKYDYPTPTNVRGRILKPKGTLLRISTAGVYIPFTGEGHIDAGLHTLQIPFVLAHEMAHGYGFGDEGTCNFLAYLACQQSDNELIRYIGELGYWRYVASNFRGYAPEEYEKFYYEILPEIIKNDLRAIYKEMDKYPDIFPDLRDLFYDNYLKAQGIEDGLENYSRILMLVKAYKKELVKQNLKNE